MKTLIFIAYICSIHNISHDYSDLINHADAPENIEYCVSVVFEWQDNFLDQDCNYLNY